MGVFQSEFRKIMASTWRVAYLVSTALVVLLFSLAGLMKLTPLLSPEVHGELVSCDIIVCVNGV